jgi:arylsulfatase A-like enzyme
MRVGTIALTGTILVAAHATSEAPARPEAPAGATRPNILLIVSDDHAFQAIGAYGSVLNRTPNIDRIAERGIRFDRALVTNSICAPSRAVILTGQYSHRNGVIDNEVVFDGSQTTFPKLLQEAGYRTAAFGKWHLKSEPTGFDEWEVLPGQGNYYNPDMRTPDGTILRPGYVTDLITDRTIEFLRGHDGERPFFVWLGHKAPHRNWLPGPDHVDTYADTEFPEPPTLFDDHAGRATPLRLQEMEIGRHMTLLGDLMLYPSRPEDGNPAWDPPRWEATIGRMLPVQRAGWERAFAEDNAAFRADPPTGDQLIRWKYHRYLRQYLGTIAGVDDNVGRVLDELDALGLSDDTIVVYTSDQGFYLGEHGWFDKRWIYEESLRTPMLVRWPGAVMAGATDASLVSNLDLAPTFLEAAGVSIPESMQGRSLVPLLRGERPGDWRDSFYYHYYESYGAHAVAAHYGVVTDRYKLVRFPATDEWELLDREIDPLEVRSFHDDPDHAAVRAQLLDELERLRAELGVID